MDAIENKFDQSGGEMRALFPDTVQAIRYSMQAGLKSVFWIGAVTMLAVFLIICTIPAKTTGEEQEEIRISSNAGA
jgi:hypothetical protein